MLSYWEKQSFVAYDYIIIGGGIVGLSTAANILEREPKAAVALFERGILPSGASTKNAGFACFGSITELLDDIQQFGAGTAMQIVRARVEGLEKLRARIGDSAMDYQNHGGYELLNADNAHCVTEINHINDWLSPLFSSPKAMLAAHAGQTTRSPVFVQDNASIARFGFSPKHVTALIKNPYESQIHTGKMMQALIRHVQMLGASIFTGADVQSYQSHQDYVEVQVTQSAPHSNISFRAKKLAICTNAFATQLKPTLRIAPGRGQVLITKPLPSLKLLGTFHAEQGFLYFRNIDDRLLLGGARHHDLNGETTTSFGDNPAVLNALKRYLEEVICPNTATEVDYHWSGIMAFGDTKKPIVEQVEKNVVVGVRMGGMGIAIGSAVAESLTDLLIA